MIVEQSKSEDIELYVGDISQRTGNRPQVLIIFDTSGSMGWDQYIKEPYDPDRKYKVINDATAFDSDELYYVKGSGIDLDLLTPTTQSHFLADLNSCKTARERLSSTGFYTGRLREYQFQGHSGSWQELPDTDGSDIRLVDCADDVEQAVSDAEENFGWIKKDDGTVTELPLSKKDGYPVNGYGDATDPIYYTSLPENSNVSWTGEVVTIYTGNYLRWRNNDTLPIVKRTRLSIAQKTITDLIRSVPSVDFGLQVFNQNFGVAYGTDSNGGRIVFDIQEENREHLIDIVNDDIFAQGSTPLCESLYEAMLYLGGKSVKYGKQQLVYYDYYKSKFYYYPSGSPRKPIIDPTAQSSGSYNTPYRECNNEIFIIYMTDGAPTGDQEADALIKALPGGVGAPFKFSNYYDDNYLAELAKWMRNNDLNDDLDGKQTMKMYTIGFGDSFTDIDDPEVTEETKLLYLTATNTEGQYYSASDPSSLLSSLQSIIVEISKTSSTFTAPSVATNNFDRTETLDSVYYAMFLPDRGPRWQGNLKKLKVIGEEQYDLKGNLAIDKASNNISSEAFTYWNTTPKADGNDVEEGGVAAMLRKKTDRVIYSDFGGVSGLKSLTTSNAKANFGVAELAAEMGILETEIDDYLKWAKGIDIDDADGDGDKDDMRPDVFGDPLHSKPLVINYGGEGTPDIRIIIGTNAGALHMFQDKGKDVVDETWAFMPKEFFKNIKKLRDNYASSSKVYGIDGSPVSYVVDNNGDGIIDKADNDKVWMFFGLRRGGNSYYALDISDPNSPKLKWHIDASTNGFSELGQTWSVPKIAYSKINMSGGIAKPTLFFGGGYSITKDGSGIGNDDSVGRAIYMVDADTGALLWSMTPSGSGGVTTYDGRDSIPAPIAVLDSDSDGLVDRLYAGDTGGNIWRIDMPDVNTADWTVFKLAELGGNTLPDDRRFFSEPSIVRTLFTDTLITTETDAYGVTTEVVKRQERPYDAILIGSGDRTSPLKTTTENKFFMVRDDNVITKSFTGDTGAEIPATIKLIDLYDYTDNPFGKFSFPLSDADQKVFNDMAFDVTKQSGWFIDLQGGGEKTTASAIVIEGYAFFSSFQPASGAEGSCQIDPVQGYLYAVDLALGTTLWVRDKKYPEQKILTTTGTIETPQIIVTQDPDTSTPCTGEDCPPETKKNATIKVLASKLIVPLGATIDTWRTYIYVTE